jgi:two-component system sensor histidine kinase QseC
MKTGLSLQRRLLWMVLDVVAAARLLALAATWRDARHELDELLDAHLAQAAALLVTQQGSEAGEEERQPRCTVAASLCAQGHVSGVSRRTVAPAIPLVNSELQLKRGFTTVKHKGAAWRVFAAHGAENDGQVYVGEQLDSRNSILFAVLRSVLWPLVIALPVLVLLVWWAFRLGLLPLHRLSMRLPHRRPEALEPLLVAGMPTEMVPMATALNGLFELMRC